MLRERGETHSSVGWESVIEILDFPLGTIASEPKKKGDMESERGKGYQE
jgi:hypothetical protein